MDSLSALALDRCPDAVFVIRADGRLEYANRTACQWLHYRRDELLERVFCDVDTHISHDDWDARWRVLQENRVLAVKTDHKRRDGSVFPVQVIMMLEETIGDDGRPCEIGIAYARDLTNPLGQLEETVRSVLRERALSRLNAQERSLFELLARDATEKDITQQLNISRSTFYRIKRRMNAKLRIEGNESPDFWW